MRTAVALCVCLLVASASAVTPPEAPVPAPERLLQACKELLAGPNELRFECPSLQLRASGDAAIELEPKLLDATVALLEQRGARVERTTLLLRGAARKTLRWSTDAQRGLLLYVPVSATRIRMMSCEAGELASCAPFLEALASRLTRTQLPSAKGDRAR